MYLDMDFFEWILFGDCSVSWICRFRVFTNLGKFQLLFLWIFFQLHIFPLSFWNSDDISVKSLVTAPQVSEPLFLFCFVCSLLFWRSTFFLLFQSGKFYWFVLKFSDSSLTFPSYLWVHPVKFLRKTITVFFRSAASILVPFYNFYFFSWDFLLIYWLHENL